MPEIEKSGLASQHDDYDSEPTYVRFRKSRRSAHQSSKRSFPCHLTETRLRRLKHLLHTKGAWQQVTRIEYLCHTQVSRKRLHHFYACAGIVLTPHDYITDMQKMLSNRSFTAFGQCRQCGSFLDTQLEHGETCNTAEATRGHYACVRAVLRGLTHADAGITTEPTAKPNIFRRENPDPRAQGIVYRPLVWTADGRPHPAVIQTLQHAADLCSVLQRSANVSKSLPTQMETGNPNSPPPTKSSHDSGSPPRR